MTMTDKRTRLKTLRISLGWQGGTIHQVSTELGISVSDLLQEVTPEIANGVPYALGFRRGYIERLPIDRGAWTADHSPEFPHYWLGIVDGILHQWDRKSSKITYTPPT